MLSAGAQAPWPIAGLLTGSAIVSVGPPLLPSAPSSGLTPTWSPVPVSPHWLGVVLSRLLPPEMKGPEQLDPAADPEGTLPPVTMVSGSVVVPVVVVPLVWMFPPSPPVD